LELNAVTTYSLAKHFTTTVWINEAETTSAMLDSGSSGNFISPLLVQRFKLETQPRETPLPVTHVQGGTVGQVTEQVVCDMRIGNHRESITLDVVPIGRHTIILGLPWLQAHNPYINWSDNTLSFISTYCATSCTKEIITLQQGHTNTLSRHEQDELASMEDMDIYAVDSISVKPEELQRIPQEYHDYLDVFDAAQARKLPPFREGYDFKIDFTPESTIPRPSKPYRLTPGQMEEAKAQLKELEENGMIEPSDSPMAAPLFLCQRKMELNGWS
jgi:hypothetical protein